MVGRLLMLAAALLGGAVRAGLEDTGLGYCHTLGLGWLGTGTTETKIVNQSKLSNRHPLPPPTFLVS